MVHTDRKFDIIETLGKGAYSIVYLVATKTVKGKESRLYALKKVKMLNLNEKERRNALNEVRVLASILHPQVVCFREAYVDESDNTLCVVMDYCKNKDLSELIKEQRRKKCYVKESFIWKALWQIANGLSQLHKKNILHRDLKSSNIFLNENHDCIVGDFNVCKVLRMDTNKLMYTQTGTPFYASPEIWNEEVYDTKTDIWSLGVVIYELCCLRLPYKGKSIDTLYDNIMSQSYKDIPEHYSKELRIIVRRMLEKNRSSRITLPELLSVLRTTLKIADEGGDRKNKKLNKGENGFIKVRDEKRQKEDSENGLLLDTIKFTPNDNFLLCIDTLPSSNYASAIGSGTSPSLQAPTSCPNKVVIADRVEKQKNNASPPVPLLTALKEKDPEEKTIIQSKIQELQQKLSLLLSDERAQHQTNRQQEEIIAYGDTKGKRYSFIDNETYIGDKGSMITSNESKECNGGVSTTWGSGGNKNPLQQTRASGEKCHLAKGRKYEALRADLSFIRKENAKIIAPFACLSIERSFPSLKKKNAIKKLPPIADVGSTKLIS